VSEPREPIAPGEIGPQLVGRYEIQRRIGAGGMGVLWLARDPMLDRLVAIKVMRDGGESVADQERFLREARSAGRLHHPNIVTIFDVGQHQGVLFIAMQYIVGETLADVVNRRAPLSVARKLRWLEDLCSGLHYAHGAGIIHRDIKPANVMVDASDAIKILDFGIARLDTGSVTQGGVVGTLNYISPEQMAGGPVDRRADIFALGAVVYELFAYRRAFPGGIADGVLARILYGEPEPLDRIVPDIDPEIVTIVARCLAKNQADRYPDCLSLAQALATVRLRHDPERPLSLGDDETARAPMSAGTSEASVLVRIRAEEVRTHVARARAAMAGGAFEEAVRECERAVILDPDDSEALTVAEKARAALEQEQIEHWIVEGRAELSRHGFTAAALNADRVLALDPVSADARQLRAEVDAAERASATIRVEPGPQPQTSSPGTTAPIHVDPARGLETRRPSSRARWGMAGSLVAAALIVGGAWLWLAGPWRGSPPNEPSLPRSIEAPPSNQPQSVAAAASPGTVSSTPLTAPPTAKTQSPPPAVPPAGQALADLKLSDRGRGRGPESFAPSSPARAAAETPTVPTPTPSPTPPRPPDVRLGNSGSAGSGALVGTGITLSQPPPSPVVTPPPAPTNPLSEADKAEARRTADETAIRGVLAEYAAAYERLDAAAVKRLRSLTEQQGRQIEQQFRTFKSQSMRLDVTKLEQTDSTARVQTRMTQIVVPRSGNSYNDSSERVFEFQKVGSTWTIVRVK
jgi:hypothetical protein